ncbi:MAG: hypothetical protein MRY72_06590 [Aquisalinus sp.]|nr:hypothetical protein [Aquisalinus sp.]
MRRPEIEIRTSRLAKGISLEQMSVWTDIPEKDLLLIENGFRKAQNRHLFLLATILNIPHKALNVDLGAVEQELQQVSQNKSHPSAADTKEVLPASALIIGPYCPLDDTLEDPLQNENDTLSVKMFTNASQSFNFLGVGTSQQEKATHTPAFIILDTDIDGECYRGTAQALRSLESLKKVPVFLSSDEKLEGFRTVSEKTNVIGHIRRPENIQERNAQLFGLLSSVDRLQSYL